MLPAAEILSAERIQSGIASRQFGRAITCLDQVDSTNLFARRRAEQGASEGEMVFAEEQTQGKGRLGRTWFSPPHLNLYFSLILRPEFAPAQASHITLMAAVALAETLESILAGPPEIKWPNDILVHGRKLAGILTESSCEGMRIRFVILGIGVNVNVPADLMPVAIRARATSLYQVTGRVFDRNRLAALLIQGLERCYKDLTGAGFAALAARWERYFRLKGRPIQVQMLDQVTRGTAIGIDAEGALIIRDQDGVMQRILAGDVFPLTLSPCC
jgi:BirA family transcriptional regulator, biotin operon repressor / biotin---[acetyl-CoA-carboxylase] ligase